MRHLPIVLCVSAATLGFTSAASAGTTPLAFTLDLMAPCSGGTCSGNHPTDIALNLTSNSFSYQNDAASNSFIALMDLTAPVVCDEIAANGVTGPATPQRLAPSFSNPTPGGVLEFGAGGPAIVDLDALTYDGDVPAGVAGNYNNGGAAAPQVVCYGVNAATSGTVAIAQGPSVVFVDGFEAVQTAHPATEPWVSVQTVVSPQSAARRGSTSPAGITPSNAFGYVIQVHNASQALGWRLKLGYDTNFFDPQNNGMVAPQWCVLGNNVPQPGTLSGSAACSTVAQTHTFAAGDIQSATNSIYIYAQYIPSTSGAGAWSSLTAASFPAVAAIFPPYGTYPQRFDDKVAVATSNNRPVLNVSSITGSNNNTSTSNTLRAVGGGAVPASLTYQNSVNSGGATTVDPIAYFVDPNADTTLPGTTASDNLGVSNVSCVDPSGVLAAPITSANFTQSATARGGLALNFTFAPSGNLFVPGTVTCTATFTAAGYAPQISSTETFTITMPLATATHFSVSAPATDTAGQAVSVTLTALDAGNNQVATYSGSVTLTSSDGSATLGSPISVSGGSATFPVTFKTAGSQTVTATDSVNSIAGTSSGVTVAAAPATHFRVNAPASATNGSAFSFAVTALDQFNNTDDQYAGTVHFTSSDAAAVLPTDMTLTFGVGSPLQATLNTVGSQTISAADTVNASVTGISGAINVQ